VRSLIVGIRSGRHVVVWPINVERSRR
jgi:hypothetical protein